MSFGTVYCITNLVNGKKYIGQTILRVEDRWQEHKNHSRIYDYPIYRAMRKYGVESFCLEIVDSAKTRDELDQKERSWIKSMQTLLPNGYNAIDGPPGKSTGVSEVTRKMLSDKMKERWLREDYREKMKVSTVGVCHGIRTEAQKKRMSDAKRGKKLSEANKRNIGEASKLLWQNPEYAEKAIAGFMKSNQRKARKVVNLDTGDIYPSTNEAARLLGSFQANVQQCCQGKRARVCGYRLGYAGQEVNGDANQA
jgi:group I intron endonuclease